MTRIVNINTPLLPKEERLPTKRMIQVARLTNRGITVIGMTSLGLLAALITHHTLENKNWPIEAIVTADAISFFTAISGKVAIVLFFNEAPFLEGFKKICRQQLPDYFKLAQKNKIEKLGLTVVSEDNYVFESGRNSDYYAGDISHVEITVTREYADEYGDDDEITETYRFDANGYGAVREIIDLLKDNK